MPIQLGQIKKERQMPMLLNVIPYHVHTVYVTFCFG